jgi:hypothetical protein
MLYRCPYAFSTLAMVIALALPLAGQSVISVRSGVIHFFEGSVYLGDQPLEPHPGKFPILAQGDELRTAQGSAEVLLTPGVFLRMGEKSTIRMVANDLADTRVELLAGSGIVASDEPTANTSVTLICKKWKVHFLQKGTYRIDSEPPRLWVDQGKAEVSAEATAAVPVEQGMDLPFAAVLAPKPSINEPADQLSDWSKGRSESISADNAIAAHISDDPASAGESDSGSAILTYFPLLGLAPPGLGLSSPYSSFAPYQPGFNSIYLPGYTYQPFILALWIGGYPSFPYSSTGIGITPRVGPSFPRPVVPRVPIPRPRPFPGSVVPRAPIPGPTPMHPVPHGGVYGLHR